MKIKRFITILLALILVFTFAACGKTEVGKESDTQQTGEQLNEGNTQQKDEQSKSGVTYPITIKDSYEREVVIEKEPEKVISIAPNITETIYALKRSEKLIGRTDFCDYPENVMQVASIGSLTEPNIEKITELKPDLVIASTHFKKEVLQKLEEMNIKVVVLYGEESFEGVYETIEKVGTVLNALDEANKVVEEMKAKVQDVLSKVKDKDKPNVYYVVGFGQYGDYTAGKDTFISRIIEMAGGKNAADDVIGWKYSLEKLVEKNPDILICSKYYNAKDGIKSTNGYKDLTAVKNDGLHEIDNNMIDRQGPRLADGLVEMAKIIHPEAFK